MKNDDVVNLSGLVLPCPFCGGDKIGLIKVWLGGVYRYKVKCSVCGAETRLDYDDIVIDLWYMRNGHWQADVAEKEVVDDGCGEESKHSS